MSPWLAALAIGLAFGIIQYGREIPVRLGSALAALLRIGAVVLLVALALDAPLGRTRALRPWVALDASASWLRGGDTTIWRRALREARDAHPDSLFLFGDSLRPGALNALPADPASRVRPAVDRALGRGRPLVVVTDGELDDPDALQLLPTGSRVVVVPHAAQRDVAVTAVDVPRAVVSGDTLDVRVALAAGSAGAGRGTLALTVDARRLAEVPLDSLAPGAERTVTVRARIEAPEGHAVFRAIATVPGDAERRNDTLAVSIDVSRAAGAVFASSSPDLDARYALAVLRGALSIPTRGFFRVAPGAWRVDGTLAPVSESDVRQAVRDAPVVILHGDTAMFGAPRSVTAAPMALVVPPTTDEGEWYATSAPPSPLAPALGGLPWDSLPPIVVAPVAPRGDWQGLLARQGRSGDTRVVLAGSERPRRVVVAASGLWRWRQRGGTESDAFTTLWGSIFDWLAAERADRRAAVPDERVVRAGEPVRWRRGSASDSLATVTLRRRGGPARVDTLTLRFGREASIVESPALAPGIYDATMRGGSAVLAVNASRELLPRAARVRSGAVGGAAPADTAPRLRAFWWPYALAILLLCAEWVVRRRRGMR